MSYDLYESELTVALDAAEPAPRVVLDAYDHFLPLPMPRPTFIPKRIGNRRKSSCNIYSGPSQTTRSAPRKPAATLAAANHTGPRLWIVDPIDGTRGFARKNGEFSVMIAFVDRGPDRASAWCWSRRGSG